MTTNPLPHPEYLTVREAARRLGVHENTVRNWSERGVLAPVRLQTTKARRFLADEVDRLARDRQRSGAHLRSQNVGGPEFVDGTYLDAWARRTEARTLLPETIARLLAATPGVRGLTARSGEGTGMRGWDALVDDAPGSPWVPYGPSVWEIGTDANPRAKAQTEYKKRTADPLGVQPTSTAFVFVTARRWPGAQEWERERRAEAAWRDVRVLDADDIANWLRASPAIHLWISEMVGLLPLEIRTLAAWFQQFAAQTRPALPPALLLAGRQGAVRQLKERLAGSPTLSELRADSREEATAFIAAAIAESPELSANALVALSSRGWQRLSLSSSPSILVPLTDEANLADAVARGHHVLAPLGAGDVSPERQVIWLPPLDRNEAREALRAADPALPFQRADRLAGLARRSLAALMRDPELAIGTRASPEWGREAGGHVLAPLMLLGSWSSSPADERIVSAVAGEDWETIERELSRWASSEDPPFIRSGGAWQVTSLDWAWAVLSPRLARADLERFAAAAIGVLCERDPAAELAADERPFAALKGLHREHTMTLRTGIAQGVALLGSRGEELLIGEGHSAGDHARGIVREVLARANADASAMLWRSLSSELPLLAEAAPIELLDAVESGLAGEQPLLVSMFTDREDEVPVLGISSAHSGLGWALELLCCPERYFIRAALALAALAEIDPSGRLSNRPEASLRAVLLPWLPRTSASLKKRVALLDLLRERHPQLAWRLELALMPKAHDSSMPTASPRVRRDWAVSEEPVKLSDWLAAIEAIVTRALTDAGKDATRWAELIGNLHDLPGTLSELAIDSLSALTEDDLDVAGQLRLWSTLSDLIARHRAFPDARWAMGADTLARLDEIAGRIEPNSSPERHARLFEWHPDLPGVNPGDHDAWQQALAQARADAVDDTLDGAGVVGLQRLAQESTLPRFVGVSAAEVQGQALSESMFELLDGDERDRELASGWLMRMMDTQGEAWTRQASERLPGLSSEGQLAFLRCMGAGETLWALLEGLPESVRKRYWEGATPMPRAGEDVELIVRRLVEHERAWSAIDLLAICSGPGSELHAAVSSELIVRVLDAALAEQQQPHGAVGSKGYHVGVLLDRLAAGGCESQVLGRLEWAYFGLLQHTREPTALYAALADDPELFVELLCRVYRAEDEPAGEEEASAGQVALVTNAWHVLGAWRRPPGQGPDGMIDGERLRQWVRRARLMLQDRNRVAIGDQQIGQLLSGSPEGMDGAWPAEPIRELIEDLASKDLEAGLAIGRFDARGPVSRSPYAGGALEREISETRRQWSATVEDRWPRTGRLLAQMAEDYERQAREEDARSQRLANEE